MLHKHVNQQQQQIQLPRICPPGQVFNNSTQTCELKPTPCPQGQVFNNATQTCETSPIVIGPCPTRTSIR